MQIIFHNIIENFEMNSLSEVTRNVNINSATLDLNNIIAATHSNLLKNNKTLCCKKKQAIWTFAYHKL